MTMEQFMDYYENQHSVLAKKMGKKRAINGASRYVRRYLQHEKNPITGEVIDPGYDCIMEIWWNSREEFEASQKVISSPERIDAIREDELNLFASNSNPICSVIEYDSAMGPNGEMTHIELTYRD
ncbi:EthD domain-containing protein [Sphingomonas naphthae]|uniref:EthD domain-containing protein n=1 Tax=Sphingomonas naphthae TaxID=1813468 RepID=A0ABY7TGS2_9SPHN|nr:EthD domain-containing protein [Sphingomonas naphthae]WCT72011.1 EthD domain-containing protein [Sphingomonas naphthae]